MSVVILTKNSEKVIGDCLDLVFSQSFNDFKVIIVDGNSKDRTIEIVKKYPVKVVLEEGGGKKSRFGYARNLGVKAAKGDVIAFMSSDCVADKNWLKNLIRPLGGKTVASFGRQVYLRGESRNPISKILGKYISLRMKRLFESDFPRWYYSTVNSCIKRKIVNELGGFDENLKSCEDQDIGFRIVKKGYKIRYSPEAIVYNKETTQLFEYVKKRVRDLRELKKVKRRYLG